MQLHCWDWFLKENVLYMVSKYCAQLPDLCNLQQKSNTKYEIFVAVASLDGAAVAACVDAASAWAAD